MEKEDVLADSLQTYRKLANDDQDSVRLLTIQDLIVIAKKLGPQDTKTQLLAQLRSSLSDKSWRVRYMVANHFVEVGDVRAAVTRPHTFGSSQRLWVARSLTKSLLLPLLLCSRIMRRKFGRPVPLRSLDSAN